jgi:hypothetical protein
MNTQTTLSCPNCGANITNTQNCEFCGSLLIRLQQQGIDIEQAGYKDDSKIFKGLINALKRNLDLQKAANYESLILTLILGINVDITVNEKALTRDCEPFFPDKEGDGKGHLMIGFVFYDDDNDELQKIKNLDIYELFTSNISFVADIKAYEYAIDFGLDAEGAARLISKVLHEVYSVPYEEILEFSTSTFYPETNQEGESNQEGGTNQEEGASNQGDEKSWPWWIVAIAVGLSTFLFQMC